MLNLVEETGTWLVPLTRGLISLIQKKDEGSALQKLRPIGLMASVYRLWPPCGFENIMSWQEKWADTEQTNNRAELLAVIAVMKIYDGNLEIRSDSEYVVRITTRDPERCNEENADLLNEFDTVLRLNDTRRL